MRSPSLTRQVGGGALLAGVAAVLALVVAGPEDGPAPPPPPPPAAAAAPAPPPLPALPAAVAGYDLRPVGIQTYRISLVFRLRNTIANGLDGEASEYVIDAGQARRGGKTALLVGVRARPGADPPDIPDNVNRLLDVPPVARLTLKGVPTTVYRVPGYHLAVLGPSPRRAVVAIAATRPEAEDLAGALAGVVRGRPG